MHVVWDSAEAIPTKLKTHLLPKSRATHCSRDIIVSGLIFSSGAKVALWFPCAGPRSELLLAAPLATFTSIGPPAVRRHVAKAKTAVNPIYLHLSADPAGDLSDFDVGALSNFRVRASSRSTYAILFPRYGLLVRETLSSNSDPWSKKPVTIQHLRHPCCDT